MNALQHLRPAIVMVALFTLLTGVAYPLAVTGLAQIALPFQANGSLVRDPGGQVRGSTLLAQGFAGAGYLHPRPSAAGDKGYDASASSGSNLGPMDPKLADRVKGDAKTLAAEATGAIPADAVTTSGSGLDPDVSPANAARQAPRIAAARGVSVQVVTATMARYTEQPVLGFIGQPRVNALLVNRALDREHPLPTLPRS
jgi:K+-transporting ATPase ATPase C chain